MTTWTYNGKIITELDDLSDDTIGIIYMITTEHGKKYIGRKSLFSIRKRRFGKKESKLITDKRKKLYEMVKKQSDWRVYTGSNKELNDDIKNGVKYTKKILYQANSKKQLNYFETRELFLQRVLESDEYYNSNISGKFFPKDV